MQAIRAVVVVLVLGSGPASAGCRIETGIASHYGLHDGTAWHRTASGAVFDPWKMTAAHPTLRFGTWVSVVRLDGERREVVVEITDRGPHPRLHRAIDLSVGAADVLHMRAAGLARVAILSDCPPPAR